MRAILTVIAKDQIGIIAKVSALLSENQVNILDISQTVLQEYFTMIMLVDTEKCPLPFVELSELLKSEGEKWGFDVRIQREDIFNAMHRI